VRGSSGPVACATGYALAPLRGCAYTATCERGARKEVVELVVFALGNFGPSTAILRIMLINYQCPQCGHTGQALGHLAGKGIRCPGCSASIRLPVAAKPAPMFPTQPIVWPLATALPEVEEPESTSPKEVAREARDLHRSMLAEMRRQGRQLEKMSNNVGCIYTILAIWFFFGVISWLVVAAINIGRWSAV
jgi:hypothetical protein